MLRFWRSLFASIVEERQMLCSGLVQLGLAAVLVDLQGNLEPLLGFGPPWFDHIASFILLTLAMYAVVIVLIMVVHAFTSVAVLRLSQEEMLKSFRPVATTGFILLVLCTLVHHANHRHSAEPTYDAYENLD